MYNPSVCRRACESNPCLQARLWKQGCYDWLSLDWNTDLNAFLQCLRLQPASFRHTLTAFICFVCWKALEWRGHACMERPCGIAYNFGFPLRRYSWILLIYAALIEIAGLVLRHGGGACGNAYEPSPPLCRNSWILPIHAVLIEIAGLVLRHGGGACGNAYEPSPPLCRYSWIELIQKIKLID